MRRQLTLLWPFVAGAILIAILFGQLLMPDGALADRDIPGLHLPMLSDLAKLADSGIPYWNPWIHGGQPLLSNPHYAAFYPPVWIVFLVPAYYAIALLVILHAMWAFAGSWKLARRWGCSSSSASLAAVAFVGGGAFASSPNLLNLYMGLAWFPWVVLWGDISLSRETRRDWTRAGAGTALGLAAQILCGSPITPLLSILALGSLSLDLLPTHWRRLLRLVPVVMASLGASAIQLLPTLRHISDLARGSGMDFQMATTWSTPPVRLAEWLWPRIFGDPMLADSRLYLGYPGIDRPVPLILSIYCGALIIALAAGGLLIRDLPHRRGLTVMILTGVFLALGRYNPVYSALLVKLPPFSLIRFPEKFLLLSTTGIAVTAALTWQKLLDARKHRDHRWALRIALTVGCIALAAAAALYVTPLIAPDVVIQLLKGTTADQIQWYDAGNSNSPIPTETLAARAGYLARETFFSAIFWIGTLAVLLGLSRAGTPRALLIVLALGLSMIEAIYYTRTINNPVPAEVLLEPPRSLRELPPAMGRVFSDAILFGDTEFLIAESDSAVPASLRGYLQRLDPYCANLWGYGYALDPDTDLMLSRWGQHAVEVLLSRSGLTTRGWIEPAYRLLGAWNVGIVVRRRSPKAQMEENERTGAPPDSVRLLTNPFVLPKLRFMSEVAFVPNLEKAVDLAAARDFKLSEFDAVVEPSATAGAPHTNFDPKVQVVLLEEDGADLRLEYEAENRSFLVTAMTADRDWRAEVDGSPISIQTTALGQMGIALPPGRHTLALRHRNPAVPLGAGISLVSIFGCAIALLPRRIPYRA
jgi:hypothetical protein